MEPALTAKTVLRCFFRSYMAMAAFNVRGLQNVGLVYTLDPGLVAIHKDARDLHEARGRYIRHYNCNPFWTPFLAGVYLHTETAIAAGMADPRLFGTIKDVTANTLSAIGDSVFSGSFMIAWALAATLCVALNEPVLALALTLILFVALQAVKFGLYLAGLVHGLSALRFMRRWDIINWGDYIKVFNAFLVFLLTVNIMRPEQHPWCWFFGMTALSAAFLLVSRVHFPRIIVVLVAFAAIKVFHPAVLCF